MEELDENHKVKCWMNRLDKLRDLVEHNLLKDAIILSSQLAKDKINVDFVAKLPLKDIRLMMQQFKKIGVYLNKMYAYDTATVLLLLGMNIAKDLLKKTPITGAILEEIGTITKQRGAVELLHLFVHSAVLTRDAEDVYHSADGMLKTCFTSVSLSHADFVYGRLMVAFYTIGISLVDDTSQDLNNAIRSLEISVYLSRKLNDPPKDLLAEVKCQLGHCYCMQTKKDESMSCLESANKLWEELDWPEWEVENVLSAMVHHAEAQLLFNLDGGFSKIKEQMITFHKKCYTLNIKGLQAADAFDYLGRTAFKRGNLEMCEKFHQESLNIHINAAVQPHTNRILEQVKRLADCQEKQRDLDKAVETYRDALKQIDKEYNDHSTLGKAYLKMACLHLELRNFKDLETCLENAISYNNVVTGDDQQTIELLSMRLASWYFVGEKNGKATQEKLSEKFFRQANKYTVCGLSFVYKACHMFFEQSQRKKAMDLMGQQYPQFTGSKYLLPFNHTHRTIMNEDFNIELANIKEDQNIYLPCSVIFHYFSCLYHLNDESSDATLSSFTKLDDVVQTQLFFEGFIVEDFTPKILKALCISFVGYCHKHLRRYMEARSCFQRALKLVPGYKAAITNIQECDKTLKKMLEDRTRHV